jgi:hypothetical protein
MYTAGWNIPGYMPDSSEVFESLDDAFEWLQAEALEWNDEIHTSELWFVTEREILRWEKEAPCNYRVGKYNFFIV